MAKFRLKPTPVEAVQLRWDSWSEVCEFADVGMFNFGKPEGCYVDQDGNETEDTNGRIGLKIPRSVDGTDGFEVAAQDDWIVRMDGGLVVYKPATFAALFESHADYKVVFDPDWGKYPKLAAAFVHRPRENVYWGELRELLVEARADAVQYVHDVRAEELSAARADERRRIRALVDDSETLEGEDAARLLRDLQLGCPPDEAKLRIALAKAELAALRRPKRSTTSTWNAQPEAVCVRELSDADLLRALKNVGCHLETCDACAEVFFTGSRTHDHTCPRGR